MTACGCMCGSCNRCTTAGNNVEAQMGVFAALRVCYCAGECVTAPMSVSVHRRVWAPVGVLGARLWLCWRAGG